MIELRPYQSAALNSIFHYYNSGKRGNPLVVAPTGSGKSIIIGAFCERVRKNWPNQNILIMSHVKEILSQNRTAIKKLLPDERIGIFSAGLNRKDIAPITLASVQSAYNQPELFAENFNIVLVDEAHLIPHRGAGRYRTLLQSWSKPVVGFTATPFRLGTGYLHLGEGALFNEITYNITIKHLIEAGHLCAVSAKATEQRLDPVNCRRSGGDFVVRDLAERFNRKSINERIIDELLRYKDQRKKWLVFCIDIEHAEEINRLLNEAGITSRAVHSKSGNENRNFAIRLFKKDPALQALVSVAVLTTGFDAPDVDLVALLRPTSSPVLHVQIIGRGLRPSPNKKDCLVLDFAGNLMRNGPIDAPNIRVAGGNGTGEAPMKECPNCFEILHAAVRNCPACNHEFEFVIHLTARASDAPVLSQEEWHTVDSTDWGLHIVARNGRRMLRATYYCGLRRFNEYIGIEHGGYAAHRARHWWSRRHRLPMPDTVDEALALSGELRHPTRIKVNESGRYPKITEQELSQ